ncbi:sodium-dependent transporter [Sansalvadorimonas sp. 2012CJ34-2]|uniref:Transporter n=1 Tax=Parendozoicomonas callyspongiae TaxID=2942213 RepID=A0ABT0PG45_9GAMM|nr:sodium-dependent transporter [Sansalvadorimonas sp. 2012CJ34-2]MCL6270349.1 sodium-dependent transporter [Sansalvadorimonas sp. 2012CJ34-2]
MKREQWGSRAGFILAAVGSAIGLGNIWRFPYMAYENGGGAFLVPYLFAMLAAGIPFMILEFTLGHKHRGSAPRTLAALMPKLEILGWFQVMIASVIAVYYVAVIGWAISYFGLSFSQGWGTDANAYFFSEYLQLGENSPLNLGSLQSHIVIPVMIAWAISFLALFTGVKGGIERFGKIMMPVLFIMVVGLTLRVLFLPGAVDGVHWLFEPDFSALTNPKVWSAAFGQIFFSISVGFAIMIAYSSYLPEKSDINNNAFMTVLINCGFSMLAGVMIFAVLGYMAAEQGKPIQEVVSGGVGLAFVTIPTAINLLPLPWLLGPLFFGALVVAGVSSHISIMEAIASAIMDRSGWSRKKTASVVCGGGAAISLLFATNGGLLLLDVVDYFINNIAILGSCFVELAVIGWLLKPVELRDYANVRSDFTIGSWWENSIRFICSTFLAVLVGNNIITALTENYGGYSDNAILICGWGLLAVLLLISVAMTRGSGFSVPATASAEV